MPDDKRAKGDTCYLCGTPSQGVYCFYCRRPVCNKHIQWKGGRQFGYCPFDAKEFYKPLIDLCIQMKTNAKEKRIDKKKYLQCAIETLIEQMS